MHYIDTDPMSGLWTMEFGSTLSVFGSGVVVFQGGRILGGDSTYFYVGVYSLNGTTLSATINISPFVKNAQNLFRTAGTETLSLVGALTNDSSVIAQGHPLTKPQLKFGARLTKRA